MTKTFRELHVHSALCDALEQQGITHPFAIQELTLPLALEGNDLIGQARTGTGKTLAFGLPLLQRIDPSKKATQALVIAPTRELASQVHADLQIGAALGLTSISIYGGVPYEEQIEALTSGVHVVVGTPGRLLDHLNRGNLHLDEVTQLVLDEADEMLDMGFLPDVERLIDACKGPDRHTMLFSATMPTAIVKLARRYMDHPTFTRADHEQKNTAPLVDQHFFQVHRMDKPRILARILQSPNRGGVYVFVRTKHMADRLVGDLESLGTPAIPIHGDLRQTAREQNLDRFRSGKATVLVATEVAARGLDVTGVTHVVNYDCPDDEKMYLHRIGRTARAGEAGVAVTFAEFNEADRLNVIRKAVGATDTDVLQVFSTSEELTELFDLPAEKPWDARVKEQTNDGRGGRAGTGKDANSKRSPRDDDSSRGRRDAGTGSGRRDADAGSGQRPAGNTDGRSKNQRRSEGKRPRTEHGPSQRAPRRGTQADETPATGAVQTPSEAAPSDAATSERKSSQGRERVRTRARTRARNADTPRAERGNDDRGTAAKASDPSTEDAGNETTSERPSRGRTRGRRSAGDSGTNREGESSTKREGGTGDSRTDRERDRGESSTKRERASRDSGTDRERAGGDSDRGGSAGTSRSRKGGARKRASGRRPDDGRADERRSEDATEVQGRNQPAKDGATDERGDSGEPRSGRGRGGRQDDRGSRREARGGRGRKSGAGQSGRSRSSSQGPAQATDVGEELQKRGPEARGEGQPQPARRVKVEHLP